MSDELPAAAEPPVPGWPDESAQRLEKARAIEQMGLPVYPTRFERSHRLGEIVTGYASKRSRSSRCWRSTCGSQDAC